MLLDPNGYITNETGTFKYKKVKHTREIKVNGVIEAIVENVVCFWSKKEEKYQRSKRGSLEERIMKFKDEPSKLNASNSFGVKKYFKDISVDNDTGEILNSKKHYVFNEEKYIRDRELDGYYAIVTNDLDLNPGDIIDRYRQLSFIEDSFRVTKSDLEGRPVYVWTDEHIKGHFLTCFVSLTLYRLLQIETGRKYSVNRLKEALNSAVLLEMSNGIYHMNRVDEIVNELASNNKIELNKEFYKAENLKRELKQIVSK